ncbi:MAG: GH3 auxin-responsive promoter family protein, partial [Porcipelethomonas sp.]
MTIDNELMDNCSKAKQINCDNLIKILHDNENTQYGREHGFDSIKSIEDYRNSVPLSDYSSFESYIERMRSGAENVLTVYPLAGFCRTSGSTGRSKYIPLSRTALQRYADSFEKHKAEYLCSIAKQRFFINAFRTDLSESPAKEALFTEYNFRYIYEQGIMDINEYIGGEKMLFSDGEYDILYAKVREALCTPDIRAFECIYMYELLNFFSYIEKRWEEIYHDIESRTFPSDIRLSPSVKEYLKGIEVSDERLREIKSECCKGFEGIAGRLWKKLCLVSGISSRTNITERIALQRYMGNIKRYGLCYCSSECSIGAAVDTDSYEYVMMPQNAFFEFLPYDCRNDQTLLPHELKAGKLYEPVITNFSGLYRYKTGDVVKITGYIGESPKMEFMFRKGQALNIAG